MPEENPVDHFLKEVEKLLTFFHDHQKTPPKTPLSREETENLEKKLSKLEDAADLFFRFQQSMQKAAGLSEEQMEAAIKNIKTQNPKALRLIEHSEKLKKEVQEIKTETQKAFDAGRQQSERSDGTHTPRSKKRQKRFDRLGGHKDWKPL